MSKNPVIPRVRTFIRVLEESFHKHFPGGFISVSLIVRSACPHLYVRFSLLPKGAQRNGIIENDPSYNTFSIYGGDGRSAPFQSKGEDDVLNALMNHQLRVEMNQGGKLFGSDATNPEKIGWRNGTGTPDAILKKFSAYFKKLRSMVDARSDIDLGTEDQKFRVAYLSGPGLGDSWVAVSTETLSLDNAKSWLRSLKRQGRTAWVETENGAFYGVPGAKQERVRPEGWKRVMTTMTTNPAEIRKIKTRLLQS